MVGSMIDHTGIRVTDMAKSVAFIGRQIVRDFHAAALAAGAADNGAPGLRPQYHEHYYGGFVRDPDGHNIEACCHEAFLG